MKKLFIVLVMFSFTSCCVFKKHQKDPVKSAVDKTITELIDKKVISY